MSAKKLLFSLITTALFSSACEKINYYEDKPVVAFEKTLVIAHRGGGNDSLRENSYEACITALSLTDGIEVDIQLSKNRTIWLSHSAKVEGCNTTLKCFAETIDKEIEAITLCNGGDISYTRLEEVMSYMHRHNIRKHISIDLKGWGPCSGNSVNIEAIMRVEAEEVIKLGEKYNLLPYLIFETQFPSVLKWAKKKNSLVSAYITSFGDYEKGMLLALKHELDGISYKSNFADKLDADKISLLHKKGLRVMAWNIPDSLHADQLKAINTDILQVDL